MTFYAIMMFYFVFTRHEAENVALPDCKDGWLSLREFGNDSVTCQHPSGRFQEVTWTISSPDNNAPIFSGSCPTLGAPCLTYSDIILTRKEASSDLTIVANYRKYGNTIVSCAAPAPYSCQILIVHPANHSDCHINMDDSTLSGYCYVTQLYSSNNVYTCQWNIRYTAEGAFLMMPSILYAHNQHGQPFYRGMCAFSYPRPANGEIYLSLTVDPGLQDTHIATITIPSHQVPDATLPTLPVTVDGAETMSLMCVVSPETTRPYTWSGVQCNEENGKKTCTFTPGSIHTENVVTCLGNFSQSNYNGLTLEARFDFNNANPPDQPVITGYTTGQVLQLGHRLEMVCTVHGGSPKVSRIDFTCTGLDDGEDTSNETSVSSSVIIPSISETDNQRLCNCSASWQPQPNLVLSTSVTLAVLRAPRLTEPFQHLTERNIVLFVNSDESVQVMAYPLPVPRVEFFGDRHPSEEDSTGVVTRDLSVICKQAENIYVNNCTISLQTSTVQNTGLYSVTFANNFGGVTIVLYLHVNTKEGNAETQSFPVAAVSGGIAACVLVILLVVVILVIRHFRWKTYDHPRRRREEDTHPYTGLRPPGADGARASGTANPQGVYEEIEAEQKPQFSTENGSRLQTSNRQGNESQNRTAVPHVYENTL